ncbi:MAG: DUF5677 domain-containing protein [Arcobacteraceae bacterium]
MNIEKFNQYVSLYHNGVSIYKKLCDEVLKSDSKHSQEFYLLLLGIMDSMDTLGLLARHTKTRDCYVISRMVYESIVNVMYILATDFKAMDEMVEYTVKKAQFESARSTATDSEAVFMVFDGEKHTVGFAKNNPIKMDGDPRNWTKNNMSKRHNAINQKLGKNATRPLQLAQLVIYRISSDISHGTLYGMKHSMGLIFGKDFKDFDETHMINHNFGALTSLLMVITQAIYPLISNLEKELKLENFEKDFREHLGAMLHYGNQVVGDKDRACKK